MITVISSASMIFTPTSLFSIVLQLNVEAFIVSRLWVSVFWRFAVCAFYFFLCVLVSFSVPFLQINPFFLVKSKTVVLLLVSVPATTTKPERFLFCGFCIEKLWCKVLLWNLKERKKSLSISKNVSAKFFLFFFCHEQSFQFLFLNIVSSFYLFIYLYFFFFKKKRFYLAFIQMLSWYFTRAFYSVWIVTIPSFLFFCIISNEVVGLGFWNNKKRTLKRCFCMNILSSCLGSPSFENMIHCGAQSQYILLFPGLSLTLYYAHFFQLQDLVIHLSKNNISLQKPFNRYLTDGCLTCLTNFIFSKMNLYLLKS